MRTGTRARAHVPADRCRELLATRAGEIDVGRREHDAAAVAGDRLALPTGAFTVERRALIRLPVLLLLLGLQRAICNHVAAGRDLRTEVLLELRLVVRAD